MPTMTPTSVGLFGALVIFFLWLDLRQHKEDEAVSVRNATVWSTIWVLVSLSFCGYVGYAYGKDNAFRFLTGYVLEQSLSVDNLFVFMAIFASFGIRDAFQHRVLYYGILGAVVLRLLFVGLGTSLLVAGGINENLHMTVFGLFGLIVLFSCYQMYKALSDGDKEVEDYSSHWSVRWTNRFIPVHPRLEGHAFFFKHEGRWKATPLFLCLVTVNVVDIAFAFDSVPAVIAVTQEPFLIYTSNIFAILGLRSLYFLLTAARRFLCHLEKAIVAILAFIGVKLMLEAFRTPIADWSGSHLEITPATSLIIVLGMLALGIVGSLVFPQRATAPSGDGA